MEAQELDRSLGELVAEHPRLAALFDELGLDYCCGGQQALAEAGADHGLDLSLLAQRVRDGIRSSDREAGGGGGGVPEPRLQEMGLAQLADHIESTHHVYLRAELPHIAKLLEKVERAHGERHPELKQVGSVFGQLAAELTEHMHKEERILFPAIRRLAGSGPAGPVPLELAMPIRVMEREHESAGQALDRLRHLTAGYATPSDGCASWRELMDAMVRLEQDLHRHIHAENYVLFPRALELESGMAGA
jgi:regulator of cell morphogenesis and NO signaling